VWPWFDRSILMIKFSAQDITNLALGIDYRGFEG
jgi:hypothetical protein